MLVSLQCDKFMSHGEVRAPLVFHAGLNAVLGDDNGSNSIGKSTFLMVLDFVFGGDDYVKKCTDVQENVKGHTIKFAFEFDSVMYYFTRNTIDYLFVSQCDVQYNSLPGKEKIPIKTYNAFLTEKYKLTTDDLSWRGAVARFIRVYKRETLDEERPLRSAKDEKAADAIKKFMQLYGKYAAVDAQIKQAAQAEDEKEAFRKSLQYQHIRGARSKKEFDENQARITSLEEKERTLAEESSQGLLNLDSVQAQKLAEIRDLLANYRRQKARVQMQLNDVRKEMLYGKKSFKRTYSDLERFFPDVEFRHIEEIEGFHQQLAKVLTEDFKEAEKNLAATYVLLNNEIVRLQQEFAEVEKIPNVTEAILKEYAAITTELSNLTEANRNFEEMDRLKQVADEYAETRDEVIKAQLFSIETTLNLRMREISARILHDEQHLPPMLRMTKLSQYSFSTPNDGGTGAQYRGVVTFDLANMAEGVIPFIVHDSVMLKHIEKKVVSEIIRAYDATKTSGQQVFIAFDSMESYSSQTREILNKNKVLELSPKDGALFGRVWNISDTETGAEDNRR